MSNDFPKTETRIAVAMSGGVDSSYVAAMLQEMGYSVFGIHMDLWEDSPLFDGPNGAQKRNSTRETLKRTADLLGIPVHTVSLAAHFYQYVVQPFIQTYTEGRTPNPCVRCNRTIKFGALLEEARRMGADALATGHYAKITTTLSGRKAIAPPMDRYKNQAYYLYGLSQDALSRILFPLESLTKDEVRQRAARIGLPAANNEDSQEICFIHDNDYRRFLTEAGVVFQKGRFLDTNEGILGEHGGKENFTVGQRKGLGIALGSPRYVTEIRANGDVVLGDSHSVFRHQFDLIEPSFQGWDPETLMADMDYRALVQVRYRSTPTPATVRFLFSDAARGQGSVPDIVRVITDDPVSAVTPGQSGVLYSDDNARILLAGGFINRF